MTRIVRAIATLSILSGALVTASAQPPECGATTFLGQTEGDFVIKDFHFIQRRSSS